MLGIVIPIYNEEAVLDLLFERVRKAIDALGMPATVCLIDDGSQDGSLAKMQDFSRRDPRFRYLSFSRNFGHQTAILAGLRELDADVYVIMDGDLQDPPEIIGELLAKWRDNYQVVYCVRTDRKECLILRAAYALFYRILRSVSYLEIPLDTGDFCLLDRKIVDHLRSMKEHNQFIRGLRTWVGYRQTGVPYGRAARAGGKSKYSLRRLLALAYDGVISFSFAPLKVVINLGMAISFVSFLGVCFLVIDKLFFGIPLVGWTSLAVLILFMGGIQLLTVGIIGEYLGRIFDEVKGRPLYIVKETNLTRPQEHQPRPPA
jgi:dolichol-phosphate mannosyltransferase